MIEIGRLCVKTSGRDAGMKCIVLDILDNNFVLIDGETRRKRCNISHLEPSVQIIKIEKNASHDKVLDEFKKLGITVKEAGKKPKKVEVEKAEEQKKPSKKSEKAKK
ncbi:MAG: 50S ribosomal protein L14e [Nanoarchaeota archaeon]